MAPASAPRSHQQRPRGQGAEGVELEVAAQHVGLRQDADALRRTTWSATPLAMASSRQSRGQATLGRVVHGVEAGRARWRCARH